MKKLVRAKKSTTRAKKSAASTKAIRTQAIFLIGVGVAAGTLMLFAGNRSSQPSHAATVDVQPGALTASAARRSASGTSATAALVKTALAADTMLASSVETAARPTVQYPTSVTITGCLEQARDTFRLKDTTGVDAAKSRSWKSGFFKKSSAPIEVVDAANRLQLRTHVGQRVSVTGVIVDREMHGRTLKRIAASCDIEPVRGTGLKTIARSY
jgi:hypothetical protein